jgi:hypothetical protein
MPSLKHFSKYGIKLTPHRAEIWTGEFLEGSTVLDELSRKRYVIRWLQQHGFNEDAQGVADGTIWLSGSSSRSPIIARDVSGRYTKAQLPPIEQQLKNWMEAKKRWKAAGKPKRSKEDVSEIMNEICPECPFHIGEDKNLRCGVCGCFVPDGAFMTGKATMATEGCPKEFWPGERMYDTDYGSKRS